MNWIPTLLKAATSRGSGVHPDTWKAVAKRSPLPVPDDVKALFEQTDGARFSGEVVLWTFKEVEERTAKGLGTLKPSDASGKAAALPAMTALMTMASNRSIMSLSSSERATSALCISISISSSATERFALRRRLI